jgi:hypothetical protein
VAARTGHSDARRAAEITRTSRRDRYRQVYWRFRRYWRYR